MCGQLWVPGLQNDVHATLYPVCVYLWPQLPTYLCCVRLQVWRYHLTAESGRSMGLNFELLDALGQVAKGEWCLVLSAYGRLVRAFWSGLCVSDGILQSQGLGRQG